MDEWSEGCVAKDQSILCTFMFNKCGGLDNLLILMMMLMFVTRARGRMNNKNKIGRIKIMYTLNPLFKLPVKTLVHTSASI